MTVDDIINGILLREGDRYTNDPNDSGGPTRWGVTLATYSRYLGRQASVLDVMNMPREVASRVYRKMYYEDPQFDRVAALSPRIAEELTDTGVNCGTAIATIFLQRALNAFNRRGERYPDADVDGSIGGQTLACLKAYLDWRKEEGVTVMLKALNCLQGERYIDLAERRPKDEDYVYGWIKERA